MQYAYTKETSASANIELTYFDLRAIVDALQVASEDGAKTAYSKFVYKDLLDDFKAAKERLAKNAADYFAHQVTRDDIEF